MTDVHALAIDPEEPSIVYAGTHGGGERRRRTHLACVHRGALLYGLGTRPFRVRSIGLPGRFVMAGRGLFFSASSPEEWKALFGGEPERPVCPEVRQ